MDPYVKWTYGGKEYKTTVQSNAGKNPVWGEMFKLPVMDRKITMPITFTVMDEETFKDEEIGECAIEINQLLIPGNSCHKLMYKKSTSCGTLAWTSQWQEDTKEVIQNVWGAQASSATPKKSSGFLGFGKHDEPAPVVVPVADIAGNLTITVKKAELTHDTETFGKMDPYVTWTYEGHVYKTTVKDNAGKKPVWNEVFNLSVAKKDIAE